MRAEKALQGVEFPASRDDLLAYARERGADPKSLQALKTLPDREFGSKDEVIAAVPQEPEGGTLTGGEAR